MVKFQARPQAGQDPARPPRQVTSGSSRHRHLAGSWEQLQEGKSQGRLLPQFLHLSAEEDEAGSPVRTLGGPQGRTAAPLPGADHGDDVREARPWEPLPGQHCEDLDGKPSRR